MPAFQYRAVDKTGRPARGALDAVNEVDLELRLRRMGLDLITYREIAKSATGFGAGGRIVRRDLITFCFDMEQITRSGIPLLDGIRDLRDSITRQRSARTHQLRPIDASASLCFAHQLKKGARKRKEPADRMADEIKSSGLGLEVEAPGVTGETGDAMPARGNFKPVIRALVSGALLLPIQHEGGRAVRILRIAVDVDDRSFRNRLETLSLQVLRAGRLRRAPGQQKRKNH